MFTPVKRLLKNTVFRLSMIAAALFAASSLIVLGYIYYATVIAALNRVDKTLQDEINELTDIYQTYGPERMNKEIIFRMRPGRETLYVYGYKGQPTGNLAAQPFFTDKADRPWWKKLTEERITTSRKFIYVVEDANNIGKEPITHRARGRFKQLAPDAKLFVARDVESIMAPAERMTRALLISILIALCLGILSGIYVSRRFARRIADFNKLATDVRAGNLKQRVARDESGDELDVLAEHLNAMLDHIDRLMLAMRYAGDSIAHDLRSPLTRLKTRLESAGSEAKDAESQEALYKASEDASQLLRTFESVLRIARLEAGEQREILVPLDPKSVLEDMAELYEPACEDAGLEFALEIDGKHNIRADRGLLSQVVSNLVENAIKYTPPGGAIMVRLRKISSGRSEISITDTGPGIPQKDRERVKERFVRLEESRTAPGSGLGLAFVEAVADLHRARFELDDGPGGEGSDMPGLRASLVFPRYKKRS